MDKKNIIFEICQPRRRGWKGPRFHPSDAVHVLLDILQRVTRQSRDVRPGHDGEPEPGGDLREVRVRTRRALPDFRDGPSNRPGAYVRERAREHPQPAPRDVRPQPDRCQAVEVVAERERQQRGEAEEAHDSERIFADCSIDCGEFGVPVGDVLNPVPERVSRDEERRGRRRGRRGAHHRGSLRGPEDEPRRHGERNGRHG